MEKILAINPGSTSTKIAVYQDDECIFEKTLRHPTDEINSFETIFEQYDFRERVILEALEEQNIHLSHLTAIVGRGGMLRPMEGGTYSVNDVMLKDLEEHIRGEHASNLGAKLAYEIAKPMSIPSYIVDPVAVDEMIDVARVSGLNLMERASLFHALNQKAVARRYAKEQMKNYEDLNLIVAHLGGGISVGAHEAGRVIDVNNALDGDGPFSPERSGGLPLGPLYKMCFSGDYTLNEIKKMNYGKGGLVSYLGTNDGRDVAKMIEDGNEEAALVFDAMGYQISQEIAKHGATLKGKVDAVIITGGLAYNERLMNYIKERVSYLAHIEIYPGEDEMRSLVEGALRVQRDEEQAKIY
jgi:butyrate kinase